MSNTKNENNLTVNNSSGKGTPDGATSGYYFEMLQKCTVSKSSANLLSCILSLNDLYDKVNDVLTEMYGEERTDDLIKRYYDLSQKLESEIFYFFNSSVKESISVFEITEI